MKIFGIPIKIEVSFFVLVAFLGMSRATNVGLITEWLAVVFLSVLLHEFGHATAARAFGLSPSIRLYSMGGLTSWRSQTVLTPLRHLIISLSGPAAGFLLGGIILLAGPVVLGRGSGIATIAYLDLLWVNVGWGLFNLLPMLPLDGGTVLVTLEQWLLKRRDQIVSHTISLLTALTITGLALKARSPWIAFLGIWFAYINGNFLYQRLQIRLDQKLRPDLDQIKDARERNETDLALELILKVQRRARTSATKQETAQLLILVYLNQGKYEQAELELRRFSALYGESAYLEALLLFGMGDFSSALPYLKAAFAQTPDKQWGLMLNQSLIAGGDFADVFELCNHPAMATLKFELAVNLQGRTFEAGQFALSVKAGLLAYEQKADPNVAYNLACAHSRDSNAQEALEWVARAIDAGFSNEELLLSDPDLDAARALPEFSRIVTSKQDKPPAS